MNEWVSVGKYGLRFRMHETKTTGVGRSKRPLRYYVSVYKWKNKTLTDVYGWEGEDFKNEDNIVAVALDLRQNRRNHMPPFTLKEMIEIRESALAESERVRTEEDGRLKQEELTKIDKVFAAYCEANSHKKSMKDEVNYFKNWITPTIGAKKLGEVVLLDLERIKKRMTAAGNAARSIQYIKSIVRQIYNFAADHKIYSGEVPTINFLKKQKIDNRRQRYLSHEEATLLLEEIRKHSTTTYRVSLLSLNSGMRFGEIAGLLWQHVDTDREEILVVDTKNGESRAVYMTAAVVQMFAEMKRGAANELVFPATNGKRMERVSKIFAAAADHIGLNEGITDRRMKFVFHSLRHSCASWLVNSGVELPVIAKILGHKTLAMTMRYSHVNDRSVRNAMATLDAPLQPDAKLIRINRKG